MKTPDKFDIARESTMVRNDECAMIWCGMNLWKYDLLAYELVWDTLKPRRETKTVWSEKAIKAASKAFNEFPDLRVETLPEALRPWLCLKYPG